MRCAEQRDRFGFVSLPRCAPQGENARVTDKTDKTPRRTGRGAAEATSGASGRLGAGRGALGMPVGAVSKRKTPTFAETLASLRGRGLLERQIR